MVAIRRRGQIEWAVTVESAHESDHEEPPFGQILGQRAVVPRPPGRSATPLVVPDLSRWRARFRGGPHLGRCGSDVEVEAVGEVPDLLTVEEVARVLRIGRRLRIRR